MTESDEASPAVDEVEPEAPEPPVGEPEAGADEQPRSAEDELRRRLHEAEAARDQHLADLQRVSADFANFRKQTDKRHADTVAQAGSRLAEALLPVLDACDAAAQQGVEGIDHVADQLTHVLELEGLEIITDESEPFDPTRHEAAMSEPGDDEQDGPIVAEVLRTGYAWNGRVLRAAMVRVKG